MSLGYFVGHIACQTATWFSATAPTTTGAACLPTCKHTHAGYVSAIALGGVSAARRGRLRLAAHAALMPVYWLGISFSAYRALAQLVSAPYHWEKTEHFARAARSASVARGRSSNTPPIAAE